MKILGLTGSIATGKSFVAEVFRQNNIAVFSSDQQVGKLLQEAEVISVIKKQQKLLLSVKEDAIDKSILSNIVFNDHHALKILEEILHPLVEIKQQNFIQNNKDEKAILLEIPLLFEKKRQFCCDKVMTTYCSDKTQRERALRRKNIDNNRLDFIIKQQMPGNIKATLADYVIYTDISYQYTQKQIEQILNSYVLEKM